MNTGLAQSDADYIPSQAEEELVQAIEDAGHNLDAVRAYRDNMGEQYTPLADWEDWISGFEDSYQGEQTTADFAAYLADECYLSGKDVPQWVVSYFDYEKFERDLFMGDYWENDGHIFRSL